MAKTTCLAIGFRLEVSAHRTPVKPTGLYEPNVSFPFQLVRLSPSPTSCPGMEGQGEQEGETVGKMQLFPTCCLRWSRSCIWGFGLKLGCWQRRGSKEAQRTSLESTSHSSCTPESRKGKPLPSAFHAQVSIPLGSPCLIMKVTPSMSWSLTTRPVHPCFQWHLPWEAEAAKKPVCE